MSPHELHILPDTARLGSVMYAACHLHSDRSLCAPQWPADSVAPLKGSFTPDALRYGALWCRAAARIRHHHRHHPV